MKNGVACVCLGLLLLAGLAAARAEESGPTAREKKLEQKVEELERRVLELEKLIQRLGGTEQPAEEPEPTPDPEQRVRKEAERLAQQDKPGTLRAYWKDGLRFDTDDGAFKLKVGGRIQNDWAFMTADGTVEDRYGRFQDGTEFRKARLYVSGELYDHLIFKAQYDFAATGDADFKDVYVGLKELPVLGNVRVGHYKEPFGLERLGSSKYLTFLERGLPNAFAPSRNTGIMFYDAECDERMTWALGVFRDTDAFGRNRADGKYSVTGRLTALALYEDEGQELLHVGVGGSHRETNNDTVRFSQRPEAHLAPRFVDTGDLVADNVDLIGGEAAVVWGPASLQGEYIHAFVDDDHGPDPDFHGYYVQASYFLTGEHRNYNRSYAVFDRVRPKRNFLFPEGEGGPGAWELAARYSHIDMKDAGVDGGTLDTATVAVNWYLNPNTRVMWNYVFAEPDGSGQAHISQVRFQVEF